MFAQKTTGRKVAGRCVPQTAKNRKKPRCTLMRTRGTLTVSGRKGANRLRFGGRISRTKKLRLGTYTVRITATNANGQRSARATLTFTIVK